MARILVIDDDEYICKSLQRILEKDGYEVKLAEDGEAGLDMVSKEIPDLIIIDIVMPVKEGIETINVLLKKYPGIKIIAMSGGGQRLDARQYLDLAYKFGVRATIKKPYERGEILELVKKVLES
ncbi:MAG: response regulator [Spirochaetes bacterium]|nr:response regulator [Spirochaetota bacterium]